MRSDLSGNNTQTFDEFAREFGFEPSGVNDYYGLVQVQVDRLRAGGTALGPSHERVFQMALNRLADPAANCSEKTVNLVLEPAQAPAPARHIRGTFDFVRDNMDLVATLARELAAIQMSAPTGKSLNISVCYAQEMNSADSAWGPPVSGDRSSQVNGFVETFIAVRELFRQYAPAIRFAFSPGLRADRTLSGIRPYWPDTEFGKSVDIVGATWYVHTSKQFDPAAKLLSDYVSYYEHANKPFALDELGGAGGSLNPAVYRDNDAFLDPMLEFVGDLAVPLEYVTLFVDRQKWGCDASLQFLRPSVQPLSVANPVAATRRSLIGSPPRPRGPWMRNIPAVRAWSP
jgi:hypothetical protein